MNKSTELQFSKVGIKVPQILLPKKGTDMSKWAVVACDQYTSEPKYWSEVERLVGKNPSTFRITLPEIFLEKPRVEDRIKNINKTMQTYMSKKILETLPEGLMLIDRKTKYTKSRKGLIVALDLEHYNYNKGSKTLIRATEGTIVERLPPRIRIRKNAPVELPHIMVLIDDPKKTVIEPLFKLKNLKNKMVYDTDLMMHGGHIKGYHISDEATLKKISSSISKLADIKSYNKKYSINAKDVLLFAMGDGNHSLATAKAIWETKKKTLKGKDKINSPARYALVELVNVHDSGLQFEPIHRVLFNVEPYKLVEAFKTYSKNSGSDFSIKEFSNEKKTNKELQKLMKNKKQHCIKYVTSRETGIIIIKNPKLNLEVGTLQEFLDVYIKENPEVKIDYIHGDDVVKTLGSKPNHMGFYLPIMHKSQFFKTVIVDGALPRKTFSMGHANEKRYYLEARKIQ